MNRMLSVDLPNMLKNTYQEIIMLKIYVKSEGQKFNSYDMNRKNWIGYHPAKQNLK